MNLYLMTDLSSEGMTLAELTGSCRILTLDQARKVVDHVEK